MALLTSSNPEEVINNFLPMSLMRGDNQGLFYRPIPSLLSFHVSPVVAKSLSYWSDLSRACVSLRIDPGSSSPNASQTLLKRVSCMGWTTLEGETSLTHRIASSRFSVISKPACSLSKDFDIICQKKTLTGLYGNGKYSSRTELVGFDGWLVTILSWLPW